jgi:hypothetical protein
VPWLLSSRFLPRLFGVLVVTLGASGVLSLPAGAEAEGIVSGYGRHIQFAGYDWQAKIANVLVGPGPNFFSDTPDSVWVDDLGRLHLKLTQDATGHWLATEVVLQPSLGYGTYRFYLDPISQSLDPNVVLGLFTWNDDPAQSHREMDIELAQWGRAGAPDGRYSVQPYEIAEHMFSFDEDQADGSIAQAIQWQPGRAAFATWQGCNPTPSDDAIIASHVFTDGIPQPGGEQVRMNLWLDGGRAPSDGQTVEVVVAGFQFSPDSPQVAVGETADDGPAK